MNAILPASERIEWVRPLEIPSLLILRAEHSNRLWRLFHDTYTVCTCTRSRSEWTYRGKTHFESPGGIMLMEPGEVHVTKRLAGPADFRVLFIEPSIMINAAQAFDISPGRVHFRLAQVYRPDLFGALSRLHTSLEQAATGLERESRFASSLRLLLELCETRGFPFRVQTDRVAVRRARQYLEEHVADNVSLEDLAGAAGGIDRFHLVHAFTKAVGIAPHAYQIHLRITRARKLLKGGMPVVEIATTLGFADQSHFTRHFHHILGTTPAVYEKSTAGDALRKWGYSIRAGRAFRTTGEACSLSAGSTQPKRTGEA